MAYDLQLQLNLQLDPSNVTSLRKQIESGLSGIDVKGLNTKNFAKVNAQINNTGKLLDQGSKKAKTFFDRVEGKARGFAAYTIASTAILKLTNTITQATREAIKFETELIKISQVTGDSIRLTKNYSNELVNISKQYNVNITKVAQLTRTLTQTGLSFREAAKGAEILARTDLLATFESLTSTTEGLIAVMQTFSFSVQRAGKVLESINAVSKQFAVESSDIVEAIRRTGGAFSTAGGQIEELIALFTAVRSTSRESAETIATGFRTIFGRLQRPKTIEFFKQLGIELETAEGKFIGPYEAILAISEGLRELNIEAGSTRFAQVVEQIGGIRQISRVVPLLQQVSKSQQALSIANNASIESLKDVEKAQQGLGFQLGALQKEFGALINDIVGSSSFKFLAETFINIAKAVLRLTSALKPLMPFLATMAAFKIGRGLSKLLSGGFSLKGMKGAMGFASGGMVPGSGNGDTVPAMLTPGEFVIRKSAVQAFGASNLASINKYDTGGRIVTPDSLGSPTIRSRITRKGSKDEYTQGKKINSVDNIKLNIESIPITGAEENISDADFEKLAAKKLNAKHYGGNYPVDAIGMDSTAIEARNRSTRTPDSELADKLARYRLKIMSEENALGNSPTKDNLDLGKIIIAKNANKMASGGTVGTDTVPALLTPGEFVVNKKSAQAFGYGNLQKINKYAQGGVVDGMPVQYFKKGGKTAKAERTLSKEQRKALKEAALAKADADAGGTGLTRGGAREAEVEIGDLNKKTFKEIGEKWDKFVAEEVKRSKELYQAKISQMAEDGATAKELSDVIKEYQGTVSDIKKQAGVSKKLDMKTAGESNTKAVVEEISQREAANLAKVLEKPAKQIEKSTKTLSQKIKDGGMSVYSSLENLGISYTEAAFQAQAIVSGLKNFANLDVNQEALTQATVKGGVLSGSADAINQFADPKVIKQFGSNLNQVGKLLPKSLGGPVRKFGGMLLKNAGTIGKFAGGLAKGLNVLGYLELAGGVLDSLFSVDYGKQRDNLIALGDAAGAAEAAARAYSQEQYRAIPLIGGFLSAFGAGSGATEEDLDATGKLVVANSRLEASINGVDREVNKAKVAFQEAQQIGNVEGQQNALADQISAIDKLQENATTSLERTQSLQASGASTYGSGSAMMKGAGAGALGGAAIGAAVGSFVPVVGTLIGGLVGGAVGAIAGGAAAWASSSKLAKEQIIQGYELQGEAAKKAAEIQVGMIEGLTASLQAEAVRLAKNGGTYQDAVKNITDKFGEENVSAILDGRKLGEDPEADIKALAEDSQARDRNIMQLKQEAALLKDSETEKRAQIQAQIDVEEAELSKVNALKSGLVQTQAAIEREKKLAERRAIESAAMEYQIKLLKQMEKAYDGFNAAARDLADISEEIDNIGTGRLTTRQAAERSGYSDPRVYEMDASEIVRNRDVAMDIAADIGGARGQEITMGQQRLGTISQLSGLDMRSIYDNARDEQTGETSAKQIQDSIYEKLGITQGADPVLDESIRRYAETIAEKGIVAAGQAENEAREKATETSRQIIEQQQAKMKELFEAEKKLRDMQIELVKRQMETAQKVYDAEKDYFDKRFALATKVEDVLNPIQERGPGRAAAIARRGEQRRAVQMDALQSRRSRQFGSIGLGGQSLDQAVNNVEAGLNNVGQAAGDQAEAFERLKGQSEALLNTIQDEISIEEERLDSLIESAKAQQEYTQSLYDAQGDIVRDLVTGTDEEVGNQLATMNAAAMAAQQGSFVGIPEDMKKDIFGLFDQFGDVVIPGLGVTGRDAQREITKNEMMRRFGVDEGTATQLASKAVKDRVPIDERMAQQIEEQSRRLKALYDYEARIKMAQLKAEQDANKKFEEAVDRFAAAVAKMREELQKGGQKEEGPDPQTPEGRQAAMEGRQQQQKDQMNQQQADNRKKADQEVDRATQTREKADREYEAAKQNEAPFKNAYDAQNARYNDARARRDRYAVGSEEYKQAQQEVESIDPERQAAYQQYEAAQERTRQARIRATNARVNQQESQGRRTALETREREQNLAMQRRQEEEARMRAASPTGEAGSELFANDDSDPFGPGPQAPRQRPTANTDQGVTPPRNNNAPQAPSQPQNPTDNPADTSRLPTDATAQQGPIQVNTQGQQDITIRLPDIQGVVNQQISEMVYSAVSEKFSSLANNVRSANNFDDVANALQGEATSTQTRTA